MLIAVIQNPDDSLIWTIVGILLIIALFLFIVRR